jgi:hypothetical protein
MAACLCLPLCTNNQQHPTKAAQQVTYAGSRAKNHDAISAFMLSLRLSGEVAFCPSSPAPPPISPMLSPSSALTTTLYGVTDLRARPRQAHDRFRLQPATRGRHGPAPLVDQPRLGIRVGMHKGLDRLRAGAQPRLVSLAKQRATSRSATGLRVRASAVVSFQMNTAPLVGSPVAPASTSLPSWACSAPPARDTMAMHACVAIESA